jgi:DMSO/TMAO reductase YedYZ molybdopterin-dependent catalytic subunit
MEPPLDQKPSSEDDPPNAKLEPTSVPAEGGDGSAVLNPVVAENAAETGPRAEPHSSPPSANEEKSDLECELRLRSRRGFTTGAVAILTGLAGWCWLVTRREEEGLPWPLRRVLEFNERVARGLFRPTHRSPEFPRSAAQMPRVNGSIGLESDLDLAAWRLDVIGSAGEQTRRWLSLGDIQALPRVEMTAELRCIEGWSEIVHWAGARLADLASVTGLATRGGQPFDPIAGGGDLLRYAALETPDREYYVGLDMASALHPQTLLCYEMNGRPLTPEHGAPLRLVIPVKYGIKNLKRIGTIRFTDVRPADYWAERGYDWYAGH